MKRLPLAALLALTCALLAACAGGPIRRVSDPAAGIQQLTVHANGEWTVALRIDNFSSIPMRFDAVDIALTADGACASPMRWPAGAALPTRWPAGSMRSRRTAACAASTSTAKAR